MAALWVLISLLTIPLTILNILGPIVSGVWLAILGEWRAIGHGITGLLISPLVAGLALAPSLCLDYITAMFSEKNVKAGEYVFAFLSGLYTVAIITVWCIVVLRFFANRADAHSVIPMLIWSYGTATGVWHWAAQKSGEGFVSTSLATFFPQLGYITMINMALFGFTVAEVTNAFVVVMVAGWLLQFSTMLRFDRRLTKL